MKKIVLAVVLFFSIGVSAQNLDTVNVSLTMRAQDWAWSLGKFGSGTDSVSRARVRAIRAAVMAANPATWTTNVTINNLNGYVVMWIYNAYMNAGFGEVFAMGTTSAERATIYTNIRAISNSAIQYHIGLVDATTTGQYIYQRKVGKEILLDN